LVTSAGLTDLVVFISAFMAWTSRLNKKSAAFGRRLDAANRGDGLESQAKPGLC
jgi:hypothetical protein